MERKFAVSLVRKTYLTEEDIDGIMSCALDGGITAMWCARVEVVGEKYLGEYASDQISRGGELRFYDRESSETWVLNRAKLILGIEMAVMKGYGWSWFDENGKLDIFNIDANEADTMVQFALFGEVVFS